MPRSEPCAPRAARVLSVLLLAAASPAGAEAGLFGVTSEPPGAAIHTITGRAGTTPGFVSERDIYPNQYPEDRIDLYGTIILRREGCAEWSRRVTLEDIAQGIKATLECDDADDMKPAPVAAPEPAAGPDEAAPQPPNAARPPTAEQRLRWLQTLEALRHNGLLTDAEERRIRRRILEAAGER